MVITCPSCSARYRLNQDKIKGRGAKITCPKCSHIFVVFSDGETEGAAPEPPKTTEPPRVARASKPASVPPVPKPPDTLGDRLSSRDKDTTTGAFKAVGLEDEGSPATTTGSIRVVAPGPRKGRRRTATTIDTASRDGLPVVTRPPESDADVDAPSDPLAELDFPVPSNASDLDFREVGITTWKVKVAIGLIYDFSDISTLKKYLADKKVTEDDLISHNAKAWVRIGDIEDLDTHFIETWRIAKAEKLARGSSPKVKKPKPAGDSSADASGAFSPTGSGTFTGASATGAYRSEGDGASSSQKRTRPRRPKKPVPEESPSRTGIYLLAAVLLLGLIGWFAFGRTPAENPSLTTGTSGSAPGPAGAATPDTDAEQARIRERIRERVEQQRHEMEAEALAEADEEALANDDDTPDLVPVQPPVTERRTPPGGRVAPGRSPTPRPTAAPRAEATPPPVQRDNNGKLWFDKAKEQLAANNYGKALTMVDKAIAKCPSCGAYFELKGKIHQALGEPQEAAAAFDKASSLGISVNAAGP